MNLSLVQKSALAKAGKVSDLGDGSTHHVDFVVRIRGSMSQGASFQKCIPASANMQQLLALALSKLNMNTADAIANLVAEAAANNEEASKKLDNEFDKIKEYADSAMQRIKQATKTVCKGQLRAALEVTLLDSVDEATLHKKSIGFTLPPPMIEAKNVANVSSHSEVEE